MIYLINISSYPNFNYWVVDDTIGASLSASTPQTANRQLPLILHLRTIMNWLINLFIRQRVRDIVQNYIDCPSNWQFKSNICRLSNTKHGIEIEFYSNFNTIYRFNAGFPLINKNTLSSIEKYYLCRKFKKLAQTAYAKPIPTKATHPDEFV